MSKVLRVQLTFVVSVDEGEFSPDIDAMVEAAVKAAGVKSGDIYPDARLTVTNNPRKVK